MGTTRTAWHVLLAALLGQRAPHRFEVRSEVHLSSEPLRADYLLLRAVAEVDDRGQTLRKLWELLPKDTILEFKSTGRPYRSRNLDKLWAYLHLYYADEPVRLAARTELCGVLLVAARTPSLDADAQTLGLRWSSLGDGYWLLDGGPFALYIAEIDVVAETEDDDLLRLFGHARTHTTEARRWLSQHLADKVNDMAMHELEEYDEVIEKLVVSLPPKRRLAGLTPEQLRTELTPEQVVLALPDEALRALSAPYLATLSEPTRAAIRARLGR